MGLFEELAEQIAGTGMRIVYPEATDARILGAASRHQADGLLKPILIGQVAEVQAKAKDFGFDIQGIEIIDPENYDLYDEMLEAFLERRKGKVTEDQAKDLLKDHNYFGTMLVYMGQADGMVSGAQGTTGDTIRPALQIIKTAPEAKLVSGAVVMVKGDERYVFSDVALNIDPDAEQLADIAIQSAETARNMGIDPKVAMLSFSTKGSAAGESVDKVRQATEIAMERAPELAIDGEFQFDAAFDEVTGQRKAPGSAVAGHSNVFIFPDLDAGNIGYKIGQRLGGYEAVGPLLQGLAKPVNDLSRGCTEEDAYKTAIITAVDAYKHQQ